LTMMTEKVGMSDGCSMELPNRVTRSAQSRQDRPQK
jgi:hypothetical protein